MVATEPEKVAKDIKPGLKRPLEKLLDVALDIILPIVTFIFGYLDYQAIGGANTVYGLINGSVPMAANISALLPLGLSAILGVTFYRLGRDENIFLKVVGKGVGGFFLGSALAWGIDAIAPKAVSNGLIDDFVQAVGGIH